MGVHAWRPAAHRRNASVVLAVVGLHALLLAVRLPPAPRRDAAPSSPPIPVTLIALPAMQPAPLPLVREPKEPSRSTTKAKPRAATVQPPEPEGPLRGGPQQALAPSAEVPRQRFGLPLDRALPTLVTPPSLAEQAHARSGDAAPEPALRRDVTRAARPDCRQAYAGLVLLAIPALLASTVRDDGCKW